MCPACKALPINGQLLQPGDLAGSLARRPGRSKADIKVSLCGYRNGERVDLPVEVVDPPLGRDGDDAGKKAKKKYEKEFLLAADESKTLSEIDPTLRTIEDLIGHEERQAIGKILAKPANDVSKADISRYCQEELAAGRKGKLSSDTSKMAKALADALAILAQ